MTRKWLMMATIAALCACDRQGSADHKRDGLSTATNSLVGSPAAGMATPPLATVKPQAAGNRTSHFTSLADHDCKRLATDAETGDWTARCPGLDGVAIKVSSGDLRDDLHLGGKALGIPPLVAKGAFVALGKTLEWRGRAGEDADVVVVRALVAKADGSNGAGHLVVAKLAPTPCIVAVIDPGPDQNNRARAVADKPLPDCVKD